ncbi:MAG: amidohydrolase family protein, partial [Kordiimonadaceae bacterium]|nr:amidohydrolase family protein [Kordiimonadaceae bacterium]
MRKILIILSLLTLSAVTATAGEGTLAFVGARIIDGTAAEPMEDGVVVITDGRI